MGCAFSYVFAKCKRAMHVLGFLRNNGVSKDVIWMVYNAVVVSIMSYGWPAVCDASSTNLKQLIIMDNRMQKLTGKKEDYDLKHRLNQQCVKLAKRISSNHPLRQFFPRRPSTSYNLRDTNNHQPQCFKTKIERESFFKFYAHVDFVIT